MSRPFFVLAGGEEDPRMKLPCDMVCRPYKACPVLVYGHHSVVNPPLNLPPMNLGGDFFHL